MPRITDIRYVSERARYWVFVDGEYCTSIRDRTFPATGLTVGMQVSCDEVKRLESYHWKRVYGEDAWQREKTRLNRVKYMLERREPRICVRIVGFGANSTEFIEEHPDEAGVPDMMIDIRDGGVPLLAVEVTGTESMRGTSYWVRPDKLEHARRQPAQDTWIVLHYQCPEEHVVAIKPDPQRSYKVRKVEIRGSIERYVVFDEADPDVRSFDDFVTHVTRRVDESQ